MGRTFRGADKKFKKQLKDWRNKRKNFRAVQDDKPKRDKDKEDD